MTWWANFNRQYIFHPNGLSILRGILGLTLPYFVSRPETFYHIIALFVFVIAAMTDYWDGALARRFHMETPSGKILDPTMDKILILAALAAWVRQDLYTKWWVAPIFAREILITFIRIGWLLEGKAIGAEKLGKVKFCSQVAALAFAFLYFISFDFSSLEPGRHTFSIFMNLSFVLALALTLISGWTFVWNNRQNFRSEKFANYVNALGVGFLPLAPGSWGSLVGLILIILTHWSPGLYLFVFAALIAVGYWASLQMDLTKDKDPSFVVMDEACGMMVTFLFIPLSFLSALIGFVLFRLFDVLKPFPVRYFERLPGFWGILLDDIAAGFYAWLIMLFFF